MVNIKAFVFNPFRENTYFVWDEEGSLVVIDPSFYDQEEQEAFFSLVSRENLTLREIWLTHGHFDHIFGVAALQRKYSVPVLMGEADANALLAAGNYNVDWVFNWTPAVDDFRAGVVDALTQYVAGTGDWAAVETSIVDGWAAMYAKDHA